MNQNQINTNVNGYNNTIIQFQSESTIQRPNLYSDKHTIQDYCTRKKTFGTPARFLFSLIGIVADILTITQICIPLFLKDIESIGEKNSSFFFIFLLFSCFSVILLAFIKNEFLTIHYVHRNGIYKKIYHSDSTYKLQPKRCPICGAKIIINNSNGTITFKCTHSDSHSKKSDISELDNLQLE